MQTRGINRTVPFSFHGGVWGNPKKASAEKGKKAIKLMTEKIAEILDRIEKLK
jgi:creatinine amidohydrolase/Fe(II)-dependent formamide hydrolase-like protein